MLDKLKPDILSSLSLKDYFRAFEAELTRDASVEELTALFTNQSYTESKPWLFRRQLIPIDKRFSLIEIVYDDNKKVGAIVWETKLLLSELVEWFCKPIFHNFYYDNSTEFAFISKNPEIEIIKTRHQEWLVEINPPKEYEFTKGNETIKLNDLEFNFIQFHLKK